MEMDMVSKAFEQAFVSVSQKLLGLQLQRRKQDNGIFLQQPVRQIMICTSGYLRMEIICDMPESMVLQIVSKMYGGGCRRMNRFHCISKNILILFVDMVYPV